MKNSLLSKYLLEDEDHKFNDIDFSISEHPLEEFNKILKFIFNNIFIEPEKDDYFAFLIFSFPLYLSREQLEYFSKLDEWAYDNDQNEGHIIISYFIFLLFDGLNHSERYKKNKRKFSEFQDDFSKFFKHKEFYNGGKYISGFISFSTSLINIILETSDYETHYIRSKHLINIIRLLKQNNNTLAQTYIDSLYDLEIIDLKEIIVYDGNVSLHKQTYKKFYLDHLTFLLTSNEMIIKKLDENSLIDYTFFSKILKLINEKIEYFNNNRFRTGEMIYLNKLDSEISLLISLKSITEDWKQQLRKQRVLLKKCKANLEDDMKYKTISIDIEEAFVKHISQSFNKNFVSSLVDFNFIKYSSMKMYDIVSQYCSFPLQHLSTPVMIDNTNHLHEIGSPVISSFNSIDRYILNELINEIKKNSNSLMPNIHLLRMELNNDSNLYNLFLNTWDYKISFNIQISLNSINIPNPFNYVIETVFKKEFLEECNNDLYSIILDIIITIEHYITVLSNKISSKNESAFNKDMYNLLFEHFEKYSNSYFRDILIFAYLSIHSKNSTNIRNNYIHANKLFGQENSYYIQDLILSNTAMLLLEYIYREDNRKDSYNENNFLKKY